MLRSAAKVALQETEAGFASENLKEKLTGFFNFLNFFFKESAMFLEACICCCGLIVRLSSSSFF